MGLLADLVDSIARPFRSEAKPSEVNIGRTPHLPSDASLYITHDMSVFGLGTEGEAQSALKTELEHREEEQAEDYGNDIEDNRLDDPLAFLSIDSDEEEQRQLEADLDEEELAHKAAFEEHKAEMEALTGRPYDDQIQVLHKEAWSMDSDGQTETRILVGKSSEGYHAGWDESYRGSERETVWGDAHPSYEAALSEAEGRGNEGTNAVWSVARSPLPGEPSLMLNWTDRDGEVYEMNITISQTEKGNIQYEIDPAAGGTSIDVYDTLIEAVNQTEALAGPLQFVEGKNFSSISSQVASSVGIEVEDLEDQIQEQNAEPNTIEIGEWVGAARGAAERLHLGEREDGYYYAREQTRDGDDEEEYDLTWHGPFSTLEQARRLEPDQKELATEAGARFAQSIVTDGHIDATQIEKIDRVFDNYDLKSYFVFGFATALHKLDPVTHGDSSQHTRLVAALDDRLNGVHDQHFRDEINGRITDAIQESHTDRTGMQRNEPTSVIVPSTSPSASLVALDLTEEQAESLITDKHPNDIRSQARALFNVAVNDYPIGILQGSAVLSYSAEHNKFYASVDRQQQPALQQKLGQLLSAQRSATSAKESQLGKLLPDREIERD